MVSSFWQGVRFFFKGFTLIREPKLRNYVRIPLLINTLLFAAVSWFSVRWLDHFMAGLLPDWLTFLEYIIWPLFAITYFLLVFYTFSLITVALLAPFTGTLAERTEEILRGEPNTSPTSVKAIVTGILPAIAHEASKLGYFLLRAIPLLLLFLIPGINLFAPFLWLTFSAWMMSVEYLDIPMSNHQLKFADTRETVRQNRFRCLGFGAATTVVTMIPVINFIAVPTAVCGATAMWVWMQKNRQSVQTNLETRKN